MTYNNGNGNGQIQKRRQFTNYELILLNTASQEGLCLTDVYSYVDCSNPSVLTNRLRVSGYANLADQLASNGSQLRGKKELGGMNRDERRMRLESIIVRITDKLIEQQMNKESNGLTDVEVDEKVLEAPIPDYLLNKDNPPISVEPVLLLEGKEETPSSSTDYSDYIAIHSPTDLSSAFTKRLKELEWNVYKLTKSRMYRDDFMDTDSAVSRYHSSTDRAIDNPSGSTFTTILSLLKGAGGKLYIRWEEDVKDVPAINPPPKKDKLLQRIEELENQVHLLKQQQQEK